MEIFQSFQSSAGQSPESVRPTALTIGNFDGVHKGHRALLEAVTRAACRRALVPAVLTFEPHPARVLGKGRPAPPLLTTRADKRRLLARAGVARLIEQPFTAAWAGLTPATFITEVLVGGLACRHLVVGYDFVFGAGRAGDVATLQQAGPAHGFELEVVPALGCGEAGVPSSSRIREAVERGDLDLARVLLGRPYHLHGRVIEGARRGRQLGFPTANLAVASELVPPPGVYAGWLDVGSGPRPAAISVGDNPTFEGAALTVEAHVIASEAGAPTPALDLYGRECHLAFTARLRAQVRFSGPNALADLIERIRADVVEVRARLAADLPPESLFDGVS